MEKFDYQAAVKELEEIASRVENPATGIDDIDACIRRADELVASCRAWLRETGERVSGMDD